MNYIKEDIFDLSAFENFKSDNQINKEKVVRNVIILGLIGLGAYIGHRCYQNYKRKN